MKGALFSFFCLVFSLQRCCDCTSQRKKAEYTDYEIYELIDVMHKHTNHKTFYSLLDVSPDSTPKEVSSAFRKKAIEWHPDKSLHPNAKEMFSVLSAASRILQDQEGEFPAKQHYDWLINEAPAWHRSAYYVRKIATAKLSLSQVAILLFIFINLAQFVGMWSKYLVDKIIVWDAKRTLSQMAEKEFKKMKKKVETKEVPVEKFENDDYYHAYALTLKPIHKPSISELFVFSLFSPLCSVITKVKGN